MPISDYDYEVIYDGSHEGTIQDEGSTVQMRYLIQWSDLPEFIVTLKGGWQKINENVWERIDPEPHPLFTNLYAGPVSFEHVGKPTVGPNKVVSWEYAIVTATFGPLPDTDDEGGSVGERISEELDFAVDALIIPPQALKDSSGSPLLVSRPVVKLLPCANYVITLHHVPELPGGNATRILGMLGKVNSHIFRGADPGHMRFDGARAGRSLASFSAFDTLKHWRLELRCCYRPIPWTKIYDDKGVLQDAFIGGPTPPGVPLYTSDNLNKLLPSGLGS